MVLFLFPNDSLQRAQEQDQYKREMLFLRNRTLSFSDPVEKSEVGERRSVEEAAAAAKTTAATADAAALPPPPRARRPFARVASWATEVPAEPSSKAGAGKPPLAPPSTTVTNGSAPSTSEAAAPFPSPLLLPSLPLWQRLAFKALVKTRAAGTNDKVLIMRTLTQEVSVPGAPCNVDYLARRFREARCSTPGRNASLQVLSAVGLKKSYWKRYAAIVDRLLPGNYRYLDARVRFYDELLADATLRGAPAGSSGRGRAQQFVALAAGYDSRATRFLAAPDGAEPPPSPSAPERPSPLGAASAPRLRAFEVDLPRVVRGKRVLLDELLPDERAWPRPALVAADLSDAARARDALLAAPGFDRKSRTVFTAEGLLMYLPREETVALLREMGRIAAKGSLFAFDFIDAGASGVSAHEDIESRKIPSPPGRGVFATLSHLVAGLGEPFLDAFPSDLASQRKIAEGTGWKVKEILDPSAIGERFFPEGPGRGTQHQKKKVPVVSRTNGFACWEKV